MECLNLRVVALEVGHGLCTEPGAAMSPTAEATPGALDDVALNAWAAA